MKINPQSEAALAAASLGAVRPERSGVASQTGASVGVQGASSSMQVNVSSAARTLDSASAGSGIDQKKVDAVKAAIANGTFSVNAGAIADKLLSGAQEFLSRARS